MSYSRLRRVANLALGRNRGRWIMEYPDSVFLVSYPKSGNTWMRFLVANLLDPSDSTTFANVDDRFPAIENVTERELSGASAPELLKSHESFDPRYGKVIYIVRDPRDVAVSYYHYLIKVRRIQEGHPINEFVAPFIAGEYGAGYGTWRENVGSWLGARQGNENFLCLRYEDLLSDPAEKLLHVARFLDVEASEERLQRSIKLSSADRMRELERSEDYRPSRRSRVDTPFVRVARSGQWESELPQTSAKLIEKSWGELMRELGYLK